MPELEFDLGGGQRPRPGSFTFLDLDEDAEPRSSRSPAWDPAAPGTRFSDYEVVGRLGEGAMSVVLRGRHVKSGEGVAIKVLHERLDRKPAIRERFRREALAASQVRSPHVVTVHLYGIAHGRPFMVLELMPGSVAAIVERARGERRPPPLDRVLAIASDALRGLEATHAKGLLHRDVKPDNLLVDAEGRVKLADFGLVKHLDAGGALPALTTPGVGLGTPLYMAPEQAGGQQLDPRSDLYGVGVTLYELLTLELPFSGAKTPLAHYALQSAGPAPRLRARRPDLPAALDEAVARLLSFEPAGRYKDAAAARAALEATQPATRRARVSVEAASGGGKATVEAGRPLVIGRAPESGISVEGQGISRFHCEVRHAPGGPLLVDLGSTNGTYINGRRLEGPTPLPRQSRVGLGKTDVTMRWEPC